MIICLILEVSAAVDSIFALESCCKFCQGKKINRQYLREAT